MEYKPELISDILEELKPLLADHWEEVAWYKDKVKFKPNYEKYLSMEELDMIVCVTVRDKGKLIGYNILFLMPHLHYSEDLYAMNDIIFLLPSYRHKEVAFTLIDKTEHLLRALGVSVTTLHMKPDHLFRGLAEHLGFEKQEEVFSKYIGE